MKKEQTFVLENPSGNWLPFPNGLLFLNSSKAAFIGFVGSQLINFNSMYIRDKDIIRMRGNKCEEEDSS